MKKNTNKKINRKKNQKMILLLFNVYFISIIIIYTMHILFSVY